MPVSKLLKPWKFHQMEKPFYGGAASCQMVLENDPVKATVPQFPGMTHQESLDAFIKGYATIEPGWKAAPDGVEWVMDNLSSPAYQGNFVTYAFGNADTMMRKLVWTIYHYGVAPLMLAYKTPEFGVQHWILVRGYKASAHPTSPGDTSYSISGFYITNPFPAKPAPPPPNKGSGWVAAADFHTTYMSRVVGGGYWSGKYVAVCDPDDPPEEVGRLVYPRLRLAGDEIMEPELAIEFALEDAREETFADWRGLVERARPEPPILVERLDVPGAYYYMIPFGNGMIARVDALFGQLLQLELPDEPDARAEAPKMVAREEVVRRVLGEAFELADGTMLPFRRETTMIAPALVWKPCRESLSPLYPFYRVTTGSHTMYIRIDGEVFTALNDDNAGI